MTEEVLQALLRALSFGTPLLLATLGGIVNERAGVVNLGVEGMMAVGALAAFGLASDAGSWGLAVALAALVGMLAALLHGFVTLTLRANTYVSGLALSMLGLGVSGLLGKPYEGGFLLDAAPELPFTLAAGGLAVGLWGFLFFTRPGLVLRSVGENPAAADALGISVGAVRYGAVAFGGALAGVAGAFLSLAYQPSWSDGMTGGMGWIAVALVIFTGWHPLRAVLGAVFFGLLYYLQFRLQSQDGVPTELFAAMPYVLVVAVLALAGMRRSRGAAPAALGTSYQRGAR
ncbi:nucleoside ABC transporter membrane protein [Stigmatella aurantiaca]|uniref:Nucleoside ABC transporter membrane protein n=1 Tax=Stigmatella aurantiaca TaxID=41 RepID=A0A1H8FTJ6_STIAU|nr:ABC transporter permease [Stigmatella aurantiaca]SEN34870.1 nucleoside ABC transporter membrane protein [Stigmatella aurantiaca]